MICSKCGTEIREGYMYCPKCGEEVIMVPDYEVEIEAGIEETISEVVGMIADSATEKKSTEPDVIPVFPDPVSPSNLSGISNTSTGSNGKLTKRQKILLAAGMFACLLLVIAVFRVISYFRSYYSFDVQYSKVQEEFVKGDYENAVKTAKHVISINPDDEKPRLLLADSYYQLGKYDESIAVLNELQNDFPQDITIYERLIANYEIEGDTDSIVNLSQKAETSAIKALFNDYVSNPVEFSVESGDYFEPQSLKLICDGNGVIYYTLDGRRPGEKSNIYTKPIPIDEGETVVTAVYVNEKGIKSEIVQKKYNVKIIAPATPRLITQPGDYSLPSLIKVESPAGGTIYYTTDGTDPSFDSKEYEPPLPMPLGKSEFRFAIISDSGVSGEVVVAKYNLNINGLVDKSSAENAVKLQLAALGHDVMSHEFVSKYGYSQGSRCYYIVEEYTGSGDSKKRMGTVYAVDAQTGEVFTITRNGDKGDYDFGVVS